jgi:hypothetical protein
MVYFKAYSMDVGNNVYLLSLNPVIFILYPGIQSKYRTKSGMIIGDIHGQTAARSLTNKPQD